MSFRREPRLKSQFRLATIPITAAFVLLGLPGSAQTPAPAGPSAQPASPATKPASKPASPAADQAATKQDPELEAIRNRLAKANAQTAAVLNDLKSFDGRSSRVNMQISVNENKTAALKSQIAESQTRITETENRVGQVKKASNARAARMYKHGPGNIIATLLTPRTLADIPRLTTFWKSLAEQDGKVIIQAIKAREELLEQKQDLGAATQRLDEQTAELARLRSELARSKQQRSASLAKLKTAIQEAMAAERVVLAARAEEQAAAARAAAKQAQTPKPCSPGAPGRDARLAGLLAWYAPASGAEPFLPPKLEASDVTFNGVASWYGPGFEGCRASSGATFRSAQMTAASLSLPFGTLVKVSSGGKAVVVVITDRGPYIPGRHIDLSKAAAQAIGIGGIGAVRMEILLPTEPAPPFP